MVAEYLSDVAVWTGAFWGLSAGASHLIHMRDFEVSIRYFRVLPSHFVRAYAWVAASALVLGGGLVLLPDRALVRLGALALAVTFASFAVGAIAAVRRHDLAKTVACGCVGGYLSADLTPWTWTLPAGISGLLGAGLIAGRLGSVSPLGSVGLAAAAASFVANLLLVLAVEHAGTRARRRTWLAITASRPG